MSVKDESERAQVDQLKEQTDVCRALKQTAVNKEEPAPPVVETRHKVFIGSYALVLIGLGRVLFASLAVLGFRCQICAAVV